MSTNKRNRGFEDMDIFLYAFGEDPLLIKPSIIAYLIAIGWDRGKATSYAVLVEEYSKTRKPTVTIWSIDGVFLWKDLTRWRPGRRNKNIMVE